jgi:hypothetical protein
MAGGDEVRLQGAFTFGDIVIRPRSALVSNGLSTLAVINRRAGVQAVEPPCRRPRSSSTAIRKGAHPVDDGRAGSRA